MAAHVAARASEAAGSVALVGPSATYSSLGFRVIQDVVGDFGPVAGILTALEDSPADYTLVVACDMPNLSSELLEKLFQKAERSNVDVVMPLSPEGRQPLCSVYKKSSVGPLRRAVENGTAKVMTAMERLSAAYLLPSEYADIDPSGELLLNVNRPEDILRRRPNRA